MRKHMMAPGEKASEHIWRGVHHKDKSARIAERRQASTSLCPMRMAAEGAGHRAAKEQHSLPSIRVSTLMTQFCLNTNDVLAQPVLLSG